MFDYERGISDMRWSPNGEWLVFRTTTRTPSGTTQLGSLRDVLAIRPGVDSVAVPIAATKQYAENSPVLSPNGRWLAYTSNESGQYEIYVRSFPAPGERTIVSQGGGDIPFWSPDGNTLYYEAFTSGRSTFKAARIQRNPVPVVLATDSLFMLSFINEPTPGSGLHPDGDRFIFAQNVGAVAAEGGAEPERLILVQNWFEELKARVPN